MNRVFAWLGGILFVGSLAFCGFTYLMTWSTPVSAGIRWGALALDVALFSVFALHHSLFARTRAKQAMCAMVPDHLLRSVYVWIAALLLVMVCAAWRPIGGEMYRVGGIWQALNVIAQLLGVWLIARAVAGIDALELAGIRQVRLPAPSGVEGKPATTNGLQTGGVYGVVRHPLYLGWVLVVFGAAHMTGDRLIFAAISVLYLAVAVPWEERSLVGSFGDEYVRYQQLVRWRMIPFIY